ncbi:MAG: J domain-containing protein [Dehalococcoidia bacterium]
MVEYRDYYRILGVDRNASDDEIKKAYRRLARQYHPDVNPDDPQAESKFKEINEAYQVLGDKEKRKKYDQLGANWEQYEQFSKSGAGAREGPFQWGPRYYSTGGPQYEYRTLSEEEIQDLFGGGGGFSDFFKTFFGESVGEERGRYRPGPQKGRDLKQTVEISLEEAFQGTTRRIQITDGGGNVARTIEAKIPPGVEDGSRIRLAEQGAPGLEGGKPGDLYVITKVRPHKRFERKGRDLHTDVKVPVTTAMLGGETEFKGFDGRKISLKIPPETPNGRVFRLKGRGMPRMDSPKERGDLYAKVNVEIPQNLSQREKEIFEEIAEIRKG